MMDAFAAHFSALPKPVQQRLRAIDKLLTDMLPGAERCLRYGIPTFRLKNKNVVHFAGFKGHVSLFPGAAAVAHFAPRLQGYTLSKGTIQFPHDDDLPLALIAEITRWRLQDMG